MIVEIDGYFHQVLLSGKRCSKQELMQMYIQAKELTRDTRKIPQIICQKNNFKELPYDYNKKSDFVIDTDTDWIYAPSY